MIKYRRSLHAAPGNFSCLNCGKTYKWYRGLQRHLRYECGKLPRFKCPHCPYVAKHRTHVYNHIKSNHQYCTVYVLDLENPST